MTEEALLSLIAMYERASLGSQGGRWRPTISTTVLTSQQRRDDDAGRSTATTP